MPLKICKFSTSITYLIELIFFFFFKFALLVLSWKVKAGNSYKKGKLNSTYPKYNVQALMGNLLLLYDF